jgi:hypothetical protein
MKISLKILLLASVLTACTTKYPEGPELSFLTAKQRVEGKWKWAIARKIEEGQETNLSLRFTADTLEFLADGTVTDSRYGLTGNWDLVSKNTEINLLFGEQADSLSIPSAIAFQIKLLKADEMWLEFEDDSTMIEWQLREFAD